MNWASIAVLFACLVIVAANTVAILLMRKLRRERLNHHIELEAWRATQDEAYVPEAPPGRPHAFTMHANDLEASVLNHMAAQQDMSTDKVLLQGLRIYQLVHDRQALGQTMAWTRDGRLVQDYQMKAPETSGTTYVINSLDGIRLVPPARRRALFETMEHSFLMADLAGTPITEIHWTDDGRRDVDLSTTDGQPIATLVIDEQQR